MMISSATREELASEGGTPSRYQLFQNDPNPFNAQTQTNYVIATDAMVTPGIYDLLGQTDMPSGVYFDPIHAGDSTVTKRMFFLK